MNCNEAGMLVAKYADGEIDSLQGRSIEQHLRGCAACSAKHQDLLALRARIGAEVPYFAATAGAARTGARAAGQCAGHGAGSSASAARPLALADRRRPCRLRRNAACLGRWHDGYCLAHERRRRSRGRGDARSCDIEQPSDPGRIVGPAHGQAVALRATRLFAAGAGSGQRRLCADRGPPGHARQAAGRHAGLQPIDCTRSMSSSGPSRRLRRRHCAPCAASMSCTRRARAWTGWRYPTSAPTSLTQFVQRLAQQAATP